MPPQMHSLQNLEPDPADPHLDSRNQGGLRLITSSGRKTTAMYIARVISREMDLMQKAEQHGG